MPTQQATLAANDLIVRPLSTANAVVKLSQMFPLCWAALKVLCAALHTMTIGLTRCAALLWSIANAICCSTAMQNVPLLKLHTGWLQESPSKTLLMFEALLLFVVKRLKAGSKLIHLLWTRLGM